MVSNSTKMRSVWIHLLIYILFFSISSRRISFSLILHSHFFIVLFFNFFSRNFYLGEIFFRSSWLVRLREYFIKTTQRVACLTNDQLHIMIIINKKSGSQAMVALLDTLLRSDRRNR